jgi:hypothetical protein
VVKRLAADSSSIAKGAHSSFFHLHLKAGASSRTVTAVKQSIQQLKFNSSFAF